MFELINSARNKIQESDLYYSRYVKEQSGKIYHYCSLFNEHQIHISQPATHNLHGAPVSKLANAQRRKKNLTPRRKDKRKGLKLWCSQLEAAATLRPDRIYSSFVI
jgi:hypothetical protein